MKNSRIWGTLAAVAADVAISYEWWRLSPEELAAVVFNIISRESLLVGSAVFATGAVSIFSWPAIVWCWNIPARCAEQRRQAAAIAAAEAKRREAEKQKAAEAKFALQIAPLRELLNCMLSGAGMREYAGTKSKTLPLRRVIIALLGHAPAEEEVIHIAALLRDVDALGLLPGEIPPIGEDRPEHDGLDLDWPREMGRILNFLEREGLEAARTQVVEWYGHLQPAPFGGSYPAAFRLTGESVDSIAEGRGRAVHTEEKWAPPDT